MEYALRQIDPKDSSKGLTFKLSSDEFIIGSGTADLSKYRQISFKHARFVRERRKWYVIDLDSTHGTYVNSNPIGKEKKLLCVGDHIGLGAAVCTNGFVCAFIKSNACKIEVIDLSDDESPVFKVEPEDLDISSSTKNEVANYRDCITDLSTIKSSPTNCFDSSPACPSVTGVSSADYETKPCPVYSSPYKSTFYNNECKECHINLIRCDSKSFKLPHDVQRVSSELRSCISDDEGEILFKPKKRRRIIVYSSDSDDMVDDTVSTYPSRTSPKSYRKTANTDKNLNDSYAYSQGKEIITSSDDDDANYFNFGEYDGKHEAHEKDIDFEASGDVSKKADHMFSSNSNVSNNTAHREFIDDINNSLASLEDSLNESNVHCSSHVLSNSFSNQDYKNAPSIDGENENILHEMSAGVSTDSALSHSEDHDSDSSVSSHSNIIIPSSVKKKCKAGENQSPKKKNTISQNRHWSECTKSKSGLKSERQIRYTSPLPMKHVYPRHKSEEKKISSEIAKHNSLYKKLQYKHKSNKKKENPQIHHKKIPRNIPPVKKKSSATTNLNKEKEKELSKEIHSKKKPKVIGKQPGNYSRSSFLTDLTVQQASKTASSLKQTSSKESRSSSKASNLQAISNPDLCRQYVENSHRTTDNKIDGHSPQYSSSFSNKSISNKATAKQQVIPALRKNKGQQNKVHKSDVHHTSDTETSVSAHNQKIALGQSNQFAVPAQNDTEVISASCKNKGQQNKVHKSDVHHRCKSVMSISPDNQRIAVDENNQSEVLPQNSTVFNSNKHIPVVPEPLEGSTRPIFKFDRNIMITKVVEWNVKWLYEQRKRTHVPEAVSHGAKPLPLVFNNLDDYLSSFALMLMLELWDLIFKASLPILEALDVKQNFFFIITDQKNYQNYTEYYCQAIINSLSFKPSEGVLALLGIKDEQRYLHPVFGYINSHQILDLDPNILTTPGWAGLDKKWSARAKLWSFNIIAKNRYYKPLYQTLFKGNGICFITEILDLADTLGNIKSTPLFKHILYPKGTTFSVSEQECTTSGGNFSYSQNKTIEGLSAELKKPDDKILFLHGLPGTGKTHVIIGLLEKLIFSKGPRMKVLVVAPSHEAIDEIGMRLMELNERSSWREQDIKFVKIDDPNCKKLVSPKIRHFTLKEKATKLFNKNLEIEIECEISKKEQELDALQKKYSDFQRCQKMTQLSEQLQILKKHRSSALSSNNNNALNRCAVNILVNSNIVLSTLSSCRSPILSSTFKPNSATSFTCCIVDDASQCTEPELLRTFLFGMNKLVLVGDHKLPPTVNSKLAVSYGYERSMFERFYNFFLQKHKLPIPPLKVQFRMHSEICKFPSKYFYNNHLVPAEKNDERCKRSNIQPYIVIDISGNRNVLSSPLSNYKVEVQTIFKICFQLGILDSSCSVGIIAPYRSQFAYYSSIINESPKLKTFVEVNTVEGFQGREKDIIILSCIPTDISCINSFFCKKLLNVALTRACQCLIIFGDLQTFKQNRDWSDLISDSEERQLLFAIPLCENEMEFGSTVINHIMNKRGNIR